MLSCFGENPLQELVLQFESALGENGRLEIAHGLDGGEFFGSEGSMFSGNGRGFKVGVLAGLV